MYYTTDEKRSPQFLLLRFFSYPLRTAPRHSSTCTVLNVRRSKPRAVLDAPRVSFDLERPPVSGEGLHAKAIQPRFSACSLLPRRLTFRLVHKTENRTIPMRLPNLTIEHARSSARSTSFFETFQSLWLQLLPPPLRREVASSQF